MKLQNMFTPCFCSSDKNSNPQDVLKETGFDRIKRMYRKSEFNLISPEMHYFVKCAMGSTTISAVLGAFISANEAKENYLRRNVASQFESEYLAKRHLSDSISLSVIKGGLKYAAKYGSFSSLYLLSTMTAANYNNKVTIWEHIGSGAIIGGLFRINYGLKGMAAAASAGGVLGAFAGGIIVFSMWLSNTTFEEFRSMQTYYYYESRRSGSEIKHEDLLKRTS